MNPSTGIKPDRSQWPSWHHRLNTNSFVGGGAGEGLENVQEGVDPAGGSPLEWNWNGSSPMIIPGQPQQHPSDDGSSNGDEQCKASLLLGGGQALRPLNSLANSCANLPLYYSSSDGGGNIWAGIHLNSGNGNELTTEVAGNSIFPASTEAFSRSSGIQALLTRSNALSQYQGVNSMMSDTQRQLLELLDTMHRQQRYSTTVDETLLVPRENLHFNGDYGLDLSVPPPLALNLGGQTFFSMGNNHPSAAALFQHLGRRPRYSSPAIQVPFCQAQGCKADLTMAKHYHRRHKVCELHSKAASVVISESTQRFCQQCSRFHALSEFDDGKRSCRKRLADHNRRRRKAQPTSNTVADTPTTASNPTLPKAFTTQPSSDDSGSTGSQTLALTCNPSTEYPAMSLTPRLSTALLKGIPPPTATEMKSERTDMHTDDESFKSPPANCNSPSLSLSTNIGVGGVPSSSSTSTYTKKHPMASESQAMYYGGLELPVVSWLRPIPHESINSSSSSAATLQSPPALDSPASLSSPRDHAMPEQVSRRQYFSSSLQNLLPLNTNINTNQPHLGGCFGSPIKPKRQEVLSLLEGGEDEAVTNLEHSHYTTQLASDFLQNRFHSRASTQDGHDNALHHSQH